MSPTLSTEKAWTSESLIALCPSSAQILASNCHSLVTGARVLRETVVFRVKYKMSLGLLVLSESKKMLKE